MVDEFPELRERDVEGRRGRYAMAAAPLRDGADAVLVVRYLVRDRVIGRRHTEREVVLQYPAIAASHRKSGLVNVEIVILGRQLNQLPRLMHRRLAGSERLTDGGMRGIELFKLVRGRLLRSRDDFSVLIDLLVAEREGVVDGDIGEAKKDAAAVAPGQRRAGRCRSGEPANSVFFLQSGMVSVKLQSGVRLASLGPGMEFGEMAIIEQRRSADVWADTSVSCLELPVDAFADYRQLRPEIAMKIMRNLSGLLARRLILANAKVDLLSAY